MALNLFNLLSRTSTHTNRKRNKTREIPTLGTFGNYIPEQNVFTVRQFKLLSALYLTPDTATSLHGDLTDPFTFRAWHIRLTNRRNLYGFGLCLFVFETAQPP